MPQSWRRTQAMRNVKNRFFTNEFSRRHAEAGPVKVTDFFIVFMNFSLIMTKFTVDQKFPNSGRGGFAQELTISRLHRKHKS